MCAAGCSFDVLFVFRSREKKYCYTPLALQPSSFRQWTLRKATTKPTRAPHAEDDSTWIVILLFLSQSILRRNRRSDDRHPEGTKKGRTGNRGLSGTSQWERVSSARAGFDFTSSNLEYDDDGSSNLRRTMLVAFPEAFIAIRLTEDDCQDAQPCHVEVVGRRGCQHVC